MKTKLNHKKILITGGSGTLGRALVRHLSGANELCALSQSGRSATHPCDLTKREAIAKWFEAGAWDLVIHTAAYSDVDGCERDPEQAHRVNGLATKYLAEQCGLKKIPFVFVSTDYVFDGRKKMAYTETDACCPINIYGMTKLEGESFAARCAPVSLIVRTSWLFGEGNPQNFVDAIAARLKSEKKIAVLADQVDAPTSARDLAEALDRAGHYAVSWLRDHPRGELHHIFQFCNQGSTTRYGMTLKIRSVLGLRKTEVEKLDAMAAKDRPALRPPHCVLSTARYEKFFDVSIRPWQESLKEYLTVR